MKVGEKKYMFDLKVFQFYFCTIKRNYKVFLIYSVELLLNNNILI